MREIKKYSNNMNIANIRIIWTWIWTTKRSSGKNQWTVKWTISWWIKINAVLENISVNKFSRIIATNLAMKQVKLYKWISQVISQLIILFGVKLWNYKRGVYNLWLTDSLICLIDKLEIYRHKHIEKLKSNVQEYPGSLIQHFNIVH